MNPIIYTRIARPVDVIGADSPQAFVMLLITSLRQRRAARPTAHIAWPKPHPALFPAPITIRQGRWVLECPCGSFNSYDPEWAFSVCLSCAAIYQQAPPAEWREIEACLMQRDQEARNYWQADTLASLQRENQEHGLLEGVGI